ncbi:hypothetical protein AYO28_11360 [Pseudomonas putida]|uniref:Uncharacterized protein n=2 Tax=Pseudomonas TaxID=286 RepID=A0A177SSW4_PSEPU|nr:hypothetical protein AYO28_11360 [Pseudomonas putida]
MYPPSSRITPMTHALLALNALALTAVIAMGLLPAKTPVHSLEYRTSMQARPAVMGEAETTLTQQVKVNAQERYAF